MNKEELEKLIIEDKVSYLEIGRRLNISNTSVKRLAIELGIELPDRGRNNPHNKGTKKECLCMNCSQTFISKNSSQIYCDRNCSFEHRKANTYAKIVTGDESIIRGSYYIPDSVKEKILKEQSNKCKICRISPVWNGTTLVFVLDHIDGDAANNKRSNLRCVCPNCDSQLETYKSKNKNSARKERYIANKK